jgi:hypothetical protein
MFGVSLSKSSDSARSVQVLVPPSVDVPLLLEPPLDPLPELLELSGAPDPPVELLPPPDPVEPPVLDVLPSFPDPGGWVPE